jgi:hypothetical protein
MCRFQDQQFARKINKIDQCFKLIEGYIELIWIKIKFFREYLIQTHTIPNFIEIRSLEKKCKQANGQMPPQHHFIVCALCKEWTDSE